MAVKTITVTEDAYEALKSLKGENESFTETILRVAKKKSLWDFVGVLSEESAERMEREIREARRRHAITRKARIERIVKALEDGSS